MTNYIWCANVGWTSLTKHVKSVPFTQCIRHLGNPCGARRGTSYRNWSRTSHACVTGSYWFVSTSYVTSQGLWLGNIGHLYWNNRKWS